MIFTTTWYFAFATLTTLLFWVLPKGLPRQLALGVLCAVFHAHFAGPAGVAPIAVMMGVTYAAAVWGGPRAQAWAMVANVAALVFYKYINFVVSSLIAPWQPEWAQALQSGAGALLPSAPPLAISFFTFEFVHYLYEVRKGGAPMRNPLHFILFAIFFPSLVAGPIKRYGQFVPELEAASRRAPQWEDFSVGFWRFGVGFAKKVIVADTLTLWIDQVHPELGAQSLAMRWLFLAALGFRILFDFSGYTDMAIGAARMVGIRLPENFNWPYLATSVQDFWQRWHISLSSWIRDYVYIPLGGNRAGRGRQVLNGVLAFALCGLWHGPAWNFVLWGLYHGLGLALVVSYKRIPILALPLGKVFNHEPRIAWLLTQAYVFLGWLLFFYPVPEAVRLAKLLFGQT